MCHATSHTADVRSTVDTAQVRAYVGKYIERNFDHYADIATENITYEVNYRPAVQQWMVCTP